LLGEVQANIMPMISLGSPSEDVFETI